MSDHAFRITMAVIGSLNVLAALVGTWRMGVSHGFNYAVKNCEYEDIATDNAIKFKAIVAWLEFYSVNFQTLAMLALEHICKERSFAENEELNALVQGGPKDPDDVRKIQEYIFRLYTDDTSADIDAKAMKSPTESADISVREAAK